MSAPRAPMLKVIVNGSPREVSEGTTVAELVSSVSPSASGVAVAVNDQVLRRGAWADTAVHDADRLEILTAVQGG